MKTDAQSRNNWGDSFPASSGRLGSEAAGRSLEGGRGHGWATAIIRVSPATAGSQPDGGFAPLGRLGCILLQFGLSSTQRLGWKSAACMAFHARQQLDSEAAEGRRLERRDPKNTRTPCYAWHCTLHIMHPLSPSITYNSTHVLPPTYNMFGCLWR